MLPLQGEKHLTEMINNKDIDFIINTACNMYISTLLKFWLWYCHQITAHMSIMKESLQVREHQLQSVLERDGLHQVNFDQDMVQWNKYLKTCRGSW